MPREMREDLPPLPIDAEKSCQQVMNAITMNTSPEKDVERKSDSLEGFLFEETKQEQPVIQKSRKVTRQENMVHYISENESAIFDKIDEFPELFVENDENVMPNGVNPMPKLNARFLR